MNRERPPASCHLRAEGPETFPPRIESLECARARFRVSNHCAQVRRQTHPRRTKRRDVGQPCFSATLGKGGQMTMICLTGFLAVQTTRIFRRRGDSETRRHFAIFDTRAVCHTSISLETDPDKNEISRRASSRKKSVVVVECRAKGRTYSTDVLAVLVTCMVSFPQQVLKFNIQLLRLPFDYLYSTDFITKVLPHHFKP